ncbi:MAG: hypothetical protein ACW967_00520 [Candidatus Hodarchaeales archaeon]
MNDLVLIPALIAVVLFIEMIIFQFLLAVGITFSNPIPAYGGRYEILPIKLSILSPVAILIFIIASILVFIRADVLTGVFDPIIVDIVVWFFAFYLGSNTLVNAGSKSNLEKKIMTPISAIASLCLFIVALLLF